MQAFSNCDFQLLTAKGFNVSDIQRFQFPQCIICFGAFVEPCIGGENIRADHYRMKCGHQICEVKTLSAGLYVLKTNN